MLKIFNAFLKDKASHFRSPYKGLLILLILAGVMRLPSFNVVKSAFCTCLPKYNINTYLGRCAHGCIYCYAVKFPSFRGPTVPRLSLIEDMGKMAEATKTKLPVMLSDSTDPYQPLERKHKLTRRCVEVLAEHGFPLLIVTKSPLVTRDLNLFKKTRTIVSMTITTPQEEVAKIIEPFAPSPNQRFSALERIADEGIPTIVRIDPILPSVNSGMEDLEEIVAHAADIGVKQVTASTMKPVRGFFSTLRKENPEIFVQLQEAYSDGEWVSGYKYLSREKRLKIVGSLRNTVLKHGLQFASCREGFPQLNTTVCDGSGYIRQFLNSFVEK
jgi:DNA repair photolyase